MVELIASTTTKTGLTVRCELDTRDYPKGIMVTDADMATLNINGDIFHPEWNYTISTESWRPEAEIFGHRLSAAVDRIIVSETKIHVVGRKSNFPPPIRPGKPKMPPGRISVQEWCLAGT